MLDVTASAEPAAPKTVTTKHLAYALAEQHQLTKKQSLEMMEDLIGMITKHLKKGERVKIAGLGIFKCGIVLPAWAATRRPASRSRSRPAKRWPSAPPRNSKWRSDRRASAFLTISLFYATMVAMPRDGAIIFSDLFGKTEVLRVTCEKCGRDGRLS